RPPPPISLTSLCTAPSPAPSSSLSLHDALPISGNLEIRLVDDGGRIVRSQQLSLQALPASTLMAGVVSADASAARVLAGRACRLDRKSTRLNSSHDQISYAVFCLKKKKKKDKHT